MKNLITALRLTLVCILCFCVLYPALIWGIAQLSPNSGKGEVLLFKGKKQYANVGQQFVSDAYFWSRPSAVGYNAAGSAGGNKGPSNPEYLLQVQSRIDTFLLHNPGVSKAEIPVDLVTASGSGLDPNISVQAATVQVKRIAKLRGVEEKELYQLISQQVEKPFLGVFGPEKIHVLKLNIALDKISKQLINNKEK